MTRPVSPSAGVRLPAIGTSVPPLDLDFSHDGFLWAVLGANPPFPIPIPNPPTPGTSFRIHPTTGEVTEVADIHQEMLASIAIRPPPRMCGAAGPPPIPVVSAGGLGLLAILLAVAGAGVLAGQRRPTRA